MLVFPQFIDGAACQFPARTQLLFRTVTNELADGGTIKNEDDLAIRTEWVLQYAGLTASEASELEEFFTAVEGRLKTFVFLDPTSNLLASSEDPGSSYWSPDPNLVFTPLLPGPFENTTATAIQNLGQAEGTLYQSLECPAWFTYCISVYLRASQATAAHLIAQDQAHQTKLELLVQPVWTRRHLRFNLGSGDLGIKVGLLVPPGAEVETYGFQLEPQRSPSPYKRTLGPGGVHAHARFADDSIRLRAEGADSYGCTVRVVASTYLE